MKVATSYFYQVRNFEYYMVPISTARYAPKWYDTSNVHMDKRGILNGIEAYDLIPNDKCVCPGKDSCTSCVFLDEYSKQLCNINFKQWYSDLEKMVQRAFLKQTHFLSFSSCKEPIAVFLVHEAPDNPCSERVVIQEWFNAYSIECKELKF